MEDWTDMKQPFDPFADAAAEYCHIRHKDYPPEDRCPQAGQCPMCQDTVRAIVRAWLCSSLTP